MRNLIPITRIEDEEEPIDTASMAATVSQLPSLQTWNHACRKKSPLY